MAISAGALGVVGGLSGLFGGGAGTANVPPFTGTIPGASAGYPISISSTIGPELSGAYGTAQGINTAGGPLSSLIQSGVPSYLNSYIFQNPGQSAGVAGARTAANMGQTAARTAFGAGQGLYAPGFQAISAGESLVPFASAIETAAFDPQSQLYLQQVRNLTDQINVANTQSGLAGSGPTSPYGASVEANALSNFNLAWQNNLLNRYTQGAQAASGLVGTGVGAMRTGGDIVGNAAQIAGTAPLSYYQASGLPYQFYNQAGSDKIAGATGAAGALTAGLGPTQTSIEDIMGIAGGQNQTNQSALNAYLAQLDAYSAQNQLQLAAQQQNFNQQQAYGRALGGGLAMIGGGFGGGTGGNLWSGLNFNNSPFWGSVYNANNPLPSTGAFG